MSARARVLRVKHGATSAGHSSVIAVHFFSSMPEKTDITFPHRSGFKEVTHTQTHTQTHTHCIEAAIAGDEKSAHTIRQCTNIYKMQL